MKTIQIIGDHGHMIDGVHRTAASGTLAVVDVVADKLIQIGHAELVPVGTEPKVGKPLADSVSPLVPHADPLHAARALSLVVEEHPGLVDLDRASPAPIPRMAGARPGEKAKERTAPVAATPPVGDVPVVAIPPATKGP